MTSLSAPALERGERPEGLRRAKFGPLARKVVLTAHVVSAVGWMGAVAVFLVLAVAASTRGSVDTVRAAFIAMELAYLALVPLAAVALVSGVVQALSAKWGLLRHYWVVAKLALTLVAFTLMVVSLERVSAHADQVTRHPDPAHLSGAAVHDVQHAAGGLAVLLVAAILGLHKPRGLTRYGRRKRKQLRPQGGSRDRSVA